MHLVEKKVLVYGAAKSGISAVRLLQRLGAFVILFDRNTKLTQEEFKDNIDIDNNFLLVTGTLEDSLLDTIELLVISPGVPYDAPDILKVKDKNIPIWGEIELAFHYTQGKVIAITGTNGKTTTTTLVGEIVKSFFEDVHVVGNIGECYSSHALETKEESVTVIEVSSFQLETIHEFKPDISVILNITPDHLDRHYTMENYIRMKERVAINQTMSELCILNYEDTKLQTMAERLNTKVMFFSSARKLEEGLYLEEDNIYYANRMKTELLCNVNDLKILGKHNYENVMAAIGVGIEMGIPLEHIKRAIINFKAVEHRIEYVDTIHGVTYYNDSKGTNPDASIKAVEAMRNPTIMICGGYDKNLPFDDFIASFGGKVKYLILLGQTREQIAKAARQQGFTNIIMVDSLEEAVAVSGKMAVAGDAVLLSPACASWDMFDNFEQRGRLFKEYVKAMC